MPRRSLTRRILLLASLGLLTGCAKTDPLVAIAEPALKDKLCKSWRHQTISKDDQITEPTAAIIEGNNKARAEGWGCEYGANRAKG